MDVCMVHDYENPPSPWRIWASHQPAGDGIAIVTSRAQPCVVLFDALGGNGSVSKIANHDDGDQVDDGIGSGRPGTDDQPRVEMICTMCPTYPLHDGHMMVFFLVWWGSVLDCDILSVRHQYVPLR